MCDAIEVLWVPPNQGVHPFVSGPHAGHHHLVARVQIHQLRYGQGEVDVENLRVFQHWPIFSPLATFVCDSLGQLRLCLVTRAGLPTTGKQ